MSRISLKQWRKEEGLEEEDAFIARLGEYSLDGVAPALCDEGCEVEPDGECEHGCPSVLVAVGVI